MSELVSETFPRARKHHHCNECGRAIAPRETYSRQFCKDGGDNWVWRSHMDCRALWLKLWNISGCCWGDTLILQDEWASNKPETSEWRGEFPHVICRLELTDQLRGRE